VFSKKKRLKIFLERMEVAQSAGSIGEALALLRGVLNAVEDEFSGVPNNQSNALENRWTQASPKADNIRSVPNRPSLKRCRQVNHDTFMGEKGRGEAVCHFPV